MFRQLLYRPGFNTALRSMLKPFVTAIPVRYRFPIVEPFNLQVDAGTRLTIVSNETSYVSKVLFWEGIRGYEYHIVPLFMDLARTSAVVVDVGANLGYYAMLAALVNPEATVVAFEPSPAAFYYLERNLEANGLRRVITVRKAVSDQPGTISFIEARNPKFPHVDLHLTGASGIEDPGEGYVHERPLEVEAVTLDSVAEEHDLSGIGIIKIDAEASEHLVLRGATSVIERDRPVIFCEALVNRVEREMEEMFTRFDYALFNARKTGLVRVTKLLGENIESHDFVAVPRERVGPFQARYVP